MALLGAGACGRSASFHRAASEELETALTPGTLALSLKRTGGGHFHAVTTFEISPGENPEKPEGPVETIVTTTDLWMDRTGQYRMAEKNDKDGGREVVLHGRELALGLRYGRMIKRTAREPEPTRMLEEALGGPWAIWEMARRFAEVDRREDQSTGTKTVLFPLQKADSPQPVKAGFGATSPLRQWRDSVARRGAQRRRAAGSQRRLHLHPDGRGVLAASRGPPVLRRCPGRGLRQGSGQGESDRPAKCGRACAPPAHHT